MIEATLYLTAVNRDRVLDGAWVYGAFHLSEECSALHRLCNGHHTSSAVPVRARWNPGTSAWKSRVFVNEEVAGHVCSLCFIALQRATCRRQLAEAFSVP